MSGLAFLDASWPADRIYKFPSVRASNKVLFLQIQLQHEMIIIAVDKGLCRLRQKCVGFIIIGMGDRILAFVSAHACPSARLLDCSQVPSRPGIADQGPICSPVLERATRCFFSKFDLNTGGSSLRYAQTETWWYHYYPNGGPNTRLCECPCLPVCSNARLLSNLLTPGQC